MVKKVIPFEDGGEAIMFHQEDIFDVNFGEHFLTTRVQVNAEMMTDIISRFNPELMANPFLFAKVIARKAVNDTYSHAEEMLKREIPQVFIDLLTKDLSKKEQINLLRGASLHLDHFFSIPMYACDELGYTFSKISAHHLPSDMEGRSFPQAYEVEGDQVKKSNSTDVTDGELKKAINFRKVTVAWFLKKEEKWFCFFYNYKSLSGQEQGQIEQHCHFISDKWNFTFDEVVNQLKAKRHTLPSTPHIELLGMEIYKK